MTSGLKKKTVIAAAAAFAVLAVFIQLTRSRSESSRRERVSWRELEEMFSAGDFDTPLAMLDERIAANPKNGLFHYFKGRVLYEKGEPYAALAEAERSLALGYPETSAWLLKSVIYGRKLGDRKKEAEFSSKALSRDPSDEDAYFLRGEARAALGDYAGAAGDLTSYLSFYPKAPAAYANRAAAFYELKDYPAALKDAEKALSLDRGNDYAHFMAGRSLAAMKDPRGAAERFNSAIELNPGRYEYYLGRAEAYVKLNDFYDAARDYSTAMAASEVNCCASYYYLLGSNMYRADERKTALKAAGDAIRIGGETPDYLELRGRALARSGRPKEAARDFRRMAELDPARAKDAAVYLSRLGDKGKK